MGMESIRFKKMQGAGNDFVIIDNRDYKFRLNELIELAPSICDRKFGVGADGLLALSEPHIDGLDYTMIYRNADGSDAGMCGNGARCLAYFAYRSGFGEKQRFNVHQNIYRARITRNSEVEVEFPSSTRVEELLLEEQQLFQINPGTEHIVKQVEESDLQDENVLREVGRYFRKHEQFQPLGTNVNFICGIDRDRLKIQTYERGVENLTLACGTGAIASALAWHHIHQNGDSGKEYTVKAKGGTLSVGFSFDPDTGLYSNIKLRGEAHFVFEGIYYL